MNFKTNGIAMNENIAKIPKGPPTLLWKRARIIKKNCVTTKFPNQFAADPNEAPIPRTLNGNISPISTQAIGPHESANAQI